MGVARDPVERFWELVDIGDDEDCWLWQGARQGDSYGDFVVHDRQDRGRLKIGAHCFSLMLVGINPEGLDVHHICENKLCVNPDHLKAVSRREHAEEHGWVFWTAETVITAMQGFAHKYGHPPSAVDWNVSQAKALGQHERVARWKENRWPPTSTVQRIFGSWSDGVVAAGFPRPVMGRRRS